MSNTKSDEARLAAAGPDPLAQVVAQAVAIYQAHGLDSCTGQQALAFAGHVARVQRKSAENAMEDAEAIYRLIMAIHGQICVSPENAIDLGNVLISLGRGHKEVLHKVDMQALRSVAHDAEGAP